jgi:predicted transglutaminase-like cysteine proteinase
MRLSFGTFTPIGLAFGMIVPVLFSIPAAAQGAAPPSSFIVAGTVAEPPQGYLDFCARHSDQCARADSAVAAATKSQEVAVSAVDDTVHPASTQPGISRQRFDWQGVFASAATVRGAGPENQLASIATRTLPNTDFPAMTAEFWRQLESVNRSVNAGVRSVSDRAHYGVEDFWELPFQGGGNAGDCEDYVLQKRQMLLARGIPMTALSVALVRASWGEEHAVLLVHSAQGDYVMDNLTPWIKPWTEVSYNWIKWQSANNPEIWVRPPVR